MKCRFVLSAGVSLLLVLGPATLAGQTLISETTWGGQFAEFLGDVATALDGSTYAVGTTDSFTTDQFGQPSPRIFLVKFAPDGTVVWQRIWNGETVHGRPAVAVETAGSVFVTGISTANGGDAVLLKFSADGTLLWERTWGGPENDSGNAVATGADGSVYIAGRSTSFGPSSAGTFVVKFDTAGTLVWQKISDGSAGGDALTVGADGSVYAGASVIRGDNLANFDILVIKLADAGTEVWRRTYSAGEVVDARGRMAAGPDGSIVLAGAIQAEKGGIVGIDPLIVKFDPDGNLVFNRVFGGGDTADAVAVAPDDGSIYVTGVTTASGAGFQDAFVLHLQSSGKKALGAVTWGGAGFDEGFGVAVAGGTVVLAARSTTGPPYSSTSKQRSCESCAEGTYCLAVGTTNRTSR